MWPDAATAPAFMRWQSDCHSPRRTVPFCQPNGGYPVAERTACH